MVRCRICNMLFEQITNTHLRIHGITSEDYKKRFPGAPTHSNNLLKRKAIKMIGKNTGNKRPDAVKYMKKNNPMLDEETSSKMGKTRSTNIAAGKIDALKNLGHLPSEKEKTLISIFKKLNIPLVYVGDGKKWVENKCPDFINEEMKIILELDLDMFRHVDEIRRDRNRYIKAGYKPIWLTSVDEEHVKSWVLPFFNGGLKWVKVKRVTKEKTTGRKKVYNLEVSPNNTYLAERICVHNCFADAFRASLYTAFFDNSKTMGLRHCNPTYYKKELDKVMKFRGKDPHSISSDIAKAVAMEIPMRLGIRFEDFTYREKTVGVSLQMLEYLSDMEYPVMINTKSDVIGMEPYVKALSSNKGKAAVHITMITSDEEFLKKIEPGAPSFKKRIQAAKNLTDEGIRVVARIEPYMIFMTDEKDAVEYYISELKRAGIKNITFDTYSYSANNPGIKRSFEVQGFDFRRMFLLISDSQALGSLLLTKFMNIFQENGFSCSTFDIGNSSNNDQTICCEVGDWFDGGWNNGCGVVAARYVIENSPHPVTWKQFENWVMEKGGFLSASLKTEVKKLWCLDGNTSFHISWAKGLEPVGMDENGLIWKYSPKTDYRKKILKGMMK